ncbi:hypothetical protein GXW78_16865 [Roseomonas terrae]|uniref:Capsid protein n=1 Tax=Neoroseomonas terrae TaxID=424799 RepID=A0ABS5EJZ6_9PROT|nr:phage capsid protein [Neoroseomonas terrae]MBR0651347.1 hypothetical protein [Neoroseomonas terrae]
MSTGLSQIVQIDYDARVKAAYQSMGILRPHVRVRTGVIGSTHKFRRAQRAMAKPRIPQTPLIPMGQQYAEATATLSPWQASDYTDKLDQVLNNIDERQVLAENIGGAIARRADQMVIDALDAANGSANIVHGSTGMTFAKVEAAAGLMNARSVPWGKRKLVISAKAYGNLLNEAKFTSADYVEKKAITDGKLPAILGFDIIMVPDMDEGGLPLNSTTRTNFAFDADAIGLAISVETGLEVNYIPQMMSWLSAQAFSGGAVTIDALGVIEVESTES